MSDRVLPQAALQPGVRWLAARRERAEPRDDFAPTLELVAADPPPIDIEAEIDRRIEEARIALREQVAAELADAARRDAEVARQAAQEEGLKAGYDEGHARGLEAASEVLDESRRRWDALLVSIERRHADSLADCETQAIELAAAIAARVIGEEMVTASGIRARAEMVLREVRQEEQVRICLAPQDLARLEEIDAAPSGRFTWASEPDVALGDCRVVTPTGTLEARLESQWKTLMDAMLRARGKSS